MKPVLVLGPEEPGAPSLERGQVDVCRVAPMAELVAGEGVYDAVIVINDGTAAAIQRMQMALDLRGRYGRLSIGVLAYLAAPALGVDAGEAALAEWLMLWPPLRFELKGDILSLEYQAD